MLSLLDGAIRSCAAARSGSEEDTEFLLEHIEVHLAAYRRAS
jgi:hypothetical protein